MYIDIYVRQYRCIYIYIYIRYKYICICLYIYKLTYIYICLCVDTKLPACVCNHHCVLANLQVPAQIISLRNVFSKKLGRTERLLKVQTEANVELAYRIQVCVCMNMYICQYIAYRCVCV